MKKIFITLLCLVFYQNAMAFCTTIRPRIHLNIKSVPVNYVTNLSREEFLRKAYHKPSPNTLGLTVFKLDITETAEPRIETKGPSACIQIKDITLTFGYDQLDIYIDKKYKPGSCEYEVVKEHENYHIRVAQEAITFFKHDIEIALEKAVGKLKPDIVTSQAEAENVFKQQLTQVMSELKPLLKYINDKIAEKNYIIDTPESYRKTTALCKHW